MKISILEIVLYSAMAIAVIIYATITIRDWKKKKKNKKQNKEDEEE